MFCTECGTKLNDGALFCTNCGYKIPAEAAIRPAENNVEETVVPVAVPVAQPVKPVAEQPIYSQPTSQPTGQSMYSRSTSQPTGQSMYSQPTSQPMGQSMYSQPTSQPMGQSMYSQPTGQSMGQSMYSQPMGQNAGNTYGGPNNASYNYNAVPQKPEKKGKGCLITIIVASVIGILAVLLFVLFFVFLALVGSSNELDDVDDITGVWTGTSTLVSVSGAGEMQEYLEELYGYPLSEEQIAGLYTATNEDDFMWLEIYEGYDEDGNCYPGSWDMELYMGEFFGTQEWFDLYASTYEDIDNGDYGAGCITLDSNNSFYCGAEDEDEMGEMGQQFFFVDYEDVEGDGSYTFEFMGDVTEDEYGDYIITGEILISFWYGEMEEPYTMVYEYTLDNFQSN